MEEEIQHHFLIKKRKVGMSIWKRGMLLVRKQYGMNWCAESVAVHFSHGWIRKRNVHHMWRHSVNRYDKGNEWNLDTDDWIKITMETIGSILGLSFCFGIMAFICFVGYILLNPVAK